GFHLKEIKPGYSSFKNRNLLNSGLLIKIEAFEKVGGFDEKVKLYFSDFSFINKFRKIYSQFVVINLTCLHGNSNFEAIDLDSALKRFGFYCEGAKASSHDFFDFIWSPIFAFIRAIKLSLKFKSYKFIGQFISIWFQLT
ncbi:MAG: hypothetical protein HC908_11370, partial [Calothrix sp. SM1_7_51]|nr:hypothetical protein [Calothrix sp. SM1_7_51]